MTSRKDTNDKTVLPESTMDDHAHTAIKAVLSAVPIVGGPAAELFAAIIAPSLALRRDEWLRDLAERLLRLEETVEGFKIESLTGNDPFVTAVLHATQIAVRNHNDEKREALRNAVLNVAAGRAPEEDYQAMFLNFIDTFTPWHIRILRFSKEINSMAMAKGIDTTGYLAGAVSIVLEGVFDDLKGQREFYDQIVRDLEVRGLIGMKSLHTMMTGRGIFEKKTTALGDKFLAFITAPT